MFRKHEKIMLKYSGFSIMLEVLSALILMAMLCWAVDMYPTVGDTFPIEFGNEGQVLRYAPRATSLFHPIISVLVYIIITGGCLTARRAAPPNTSCPRMAAVLNCICLCKSVYLSHEFAVTYCNMSGIPVFSWLLPAAMAAGALFAAIFALYIILLTRKKRREKL